MAPATGVSTEIRWDDEYRAVRLIVYVDGDETLEFDYSSRRAEQLGVQLIQEARRCDTLWARGPDRDTDCI